MGHHSTDHAIADGSRRSTRHRGTRALALTAVTALGAGLLSACGSSTSSSTSGGLTTVTVGVGGNIFDMPVRIADANGYFSKAGIKVNYVTLTSATGIAALQSGSVQFLSASPTDFTSALAKKLPITAIDVMGWGNPLGLVVSTKFAQDHGLTASTPAAQVAQAVAQSTAGYSSANTKAEAGIYLKAYGVDPDKVKWVSLPSPAADKAALNNHQIDWFVTSEPIPLEIQNSGDGVVVADPTKVPAWSAKSAGYGLVLVAKTSYASQNSATAKKFATAIQQATAYMNTHLSDSTVLDVAAKNLPGIPTKVLQASLQQVGWPASGKMTEADWNTTLAFLNSLGTTPGGAKVPSSDWTNTYLP